MAKFIKKNLNLLAREVCEEEGGKVNLSIAQVKEVIGILCDIFDWEATYDSSRTYRSMQLNGSKRAMQRARKELRKFQGKKASTRKKSKTSKGR